MPPKKHISREVLIQGAINLIKKGIDKPSARLVAKECGCSVVPIYSEFENMDELETEVIKELNYQLISYPIEPVKDNQFLNTGLSYISFATKEKKLFNWLFTSDKVKNSNIRDIFRPFMNKSFLTLREHEYTKSWTDDEVRQIVDDLWIYTHGLALLINSGVIEHKDREELINCLCRVFIGLEPIKGDKK